MDTEKQIIIIRNIFMVQYILWFLVQWFVIKVNKYLKMSKIVEKQVLNNLDN